MAKRKRIARSKAELKLELVDQLKILRAACVSYDSGLEAIGKHIALSLRVLLHHHGNSRSLLDQLGLRTGRYLSSAPPLNPDNLLPECNLLVWFLGVPESRCDPLVVAGGLDWYPVPFFDWWNDPVLRDKARRTMCRRELVLNVADTDGGAHVDPELDAVYMDMSRKHSLDWGVLLSARGEPTTFGGRPELACMRQVAHELLTTIHRSLPEFSEHAAPVVPQGARQHTGEQL